MIRLRSLGISTLVLLMFAAFLGQATSAQQFFLSPDTVTVCSEEPEVFTVELRADENITNLALYHVALSFDHELLELYFVNDTTWWICNGYQVDSTCIDSVPTDWTVDTVCISYDCLVWQVVDSACTDSEPSAFFVDTTCLEWNVIWDVDSTCLDSEVVIWQIDSICHDWQCIDSIGPVCIDSICLDLEIDSIPIHYECTSWLKDSTILDSICLEYQYDTTVTEWSCTEWSYDSTCADSGCVDTLFDSTAIAWECTAYAVDSICYDSSETEDPGVADFFTYKMTEIPVHDSGSLFRNEPNVQTIQFYSRMPGDSSKLIIESLIFWPKGVAANGPGLLATVKLRNKAPGIVNMTIDSLVAHDSLGNDLSVTAGQGSALLLNPPPDSFNLISPPQGKVIDAVIGDTVELVWESSRAFCPGDSVLYDLVVSDDYSFGSLNTFTIHDLQDTSYRLDATYDLWYGQVFWKVVAINTQDAERPCFPDYTYFNLELAATAPGDFSLAAPDDSSMFNTIARTSLDFAWEIPASQIPDDTLSYDAHFWLGDPAPGAEEFIVEDLDSNGTSQTIDQFQHYQDYSWQVNCTNRIGLSTWSTQYFVLSYFIRGDANSDAALGVGDAVHLIDYIFKGGPPPAFEKLGDPNCDQKISIGDVVHLINYIFKGGPAPCPDD